jgi:hypothetical protein
MRNHAQPAERHRDEEEAEQQQSPE